MTAYEDTDKLNRLNDLLDDMTQHDSDFAERWIESKRAQLALRKRLAEKRAEQPAAPIDPAEVMRLADEYARLCENWTTNGSYKDAVEKARAALARAVEAGK